MINPTQQTLYRLDNLNTEQRRISYQMSTGKKLENGSDDANTYAREIFVDDKIRTYEGLENQITKTTAQNNVADTAVSEVKTLLEFVKTELIKANTSTTSDEGKRAIAVSLAGVKENLFDLSNTQVEGEYIFAGSDSSIEAFTKDSSGKISYAGNNELRRVAVEDNSYRDRGINGFDLMMFSADVATRNDSTLSFKATDRIIDEDGSEWQLNGTTIEKLDSDGNPVVPAEIKTGVTSDGLTPATYSVDVGTADGTKFEAKTNIFDILDNIVNALNKVDELGNPIDDATANSIISSEQDNITKSYDAVNVAHAELGGKNKIFEVSLERVSSKLTQYNILSQEIGAADLSKVAVEAKALELTYTALYSTINRTNELSLVNFL